MKKFIYTLFGISIIIAFFSYVIVADVTVPIKESAFLTFKTKVQKWFYTKLLSDPNLRNKMAWSNDKLDVVIPVIAKDLPTLHHAVHSVKTMLMHPLGDIYLVSPNYEERIKEFAEKNGCIFVDENKVIPKFTNKNASSGWIAQQFIKLNADTIVKTENFLILDADTILIRPHVFTRKNKQILSFAHAISVHAKAATAKVLGFKKISNLDLVTHHMLFTKSKIGKLKAVLEELHNKPWQDSLLELGGDLSEYELYANFMLHYYPREVRLTYGYNESGLYREQLRTLEAIRMVYSQSHKSVSFHYFRKPENE